MMTPPSPERIARYLRRVLRAHRFPEVDPAGLFFAPPAARDVRRLGLALDPPEDVRGWVEAEGLDALLLHRPWKLDLAALPSDVAVLAFHLAFDERLGIGFNPYLAETLGLRGVEVLGRKEGRPLGLIGKAAPAPFVRWRRELEETFGGLEEARDGGSERIRRVAVVGAMNEQLVDEAAARGAGLYVTGKLRAAAQALAASNGLSTIAVGHARSERWALRLLGALVARRFAGVEARVYPEGREE